MYAPSSEALSESEAEPDSESFRSASLSPLSSFLSSFFLSVPLVSLPFSPFSLSFFLSASASLPAFVPSSFFTAPPGVQPASARSACASRVFWSPSASLLSAYACCPASARWLPGGLAGRPSGLSTASASFFRSSARATARRTRSSASGPVSPLSASWVKAGSRDFRTT